MPIDSHLPQADPFSLVPTFKAILLVNHTLKEVFTESFFPLNRNHFLTARYCTRQKHPTERDSMSAFIIARGSLGNTVPLCLHCTLYILYSDGSPSSKLMLSSNSKRNNLRLKAWKPVLSKEDFMAHGIIMESFSELGLGACIWSSTTGCLQLQQNWRIYQTVFSSSLALFGFPHSHLEFLFTFLLTEDSCRTQSFGTFFCSSCPETNKIMFT